MFKIDHWGRNQKGESHTKRQTGTGKTHENGNGRAGAEWRYCAEKCTNNISPDSVEAPQDALAALRREETLNVGDDKDQQAEQDSDLDHIVDKE